MEQRLKLIAAVRESLNGMSAAQLIARNVLSKETVHAMLNNHRAYGMYIAGYRKYINGYFPVYKAVHIPVDVAAPEEAA
jgi:hypothetical protein